MSLKGSSKYISQGKELLNSISEEFVYRDFDLWVNEVAKWLDKVAPDSGLSATWLAIEDCRVPFGEKYYATSDIWRALKRDVRKRLKWLGDVLESWNDKLNKVSILRNDYFIDINRIKELESITNQNFDLSRLIELCREINIAYQNECFMAIAMITRTVMNHVPPIFGFKNFTEVASNYKGKSIKISLQNIDKSLRNIADTHLHSQIKKHEILPNFTQVNFKAELDVLIGEIIRELHK